MSSELLTPRGQERGCELAASGLHQGQWGGRVVQTAVEVALGHSTRSRSPKLQKLYWLLELGTLGACEYRSCGFFILK